MKFKSEVQLEALNNATVDTDKFLVSDGDTVKYRTGAEVLSDLGITLNTASKIQHQVKAGVAISKGKAVYVTSADGTNMIVGLASNASEATSSKTMGLLDADAAINGFANVVTEGLLAGLNTVGANAGDPVWLGTNGNLLYGVANKPSAPVHMVFIGIVTRVNANNGEIFVKVQNGFELEELHNVNISSPATGDLLQYNASNSLWQNKSLALAGVIAGSGTTNYVPKFTSSSAIGNSLIYDDGNGVGIGTTSINMSAKLQLSGNLYIQNNATGAENITFSTGPQIQSDGPMGYFRSGSVYTSTMNGNVGISVTNPQALLHVSPTDSSAAFFVGEAPNVGQSGGYFMVIAPTEPSSNYSSLYHYSISETDGDGFGSTLISSNAEEGISLNSYNYGSTDGSAITMNPSAMNLEKTGGALNITGYDATNINIGTYTTGGGSVNLLCRGNTAISIEATTGYVGILNSVPSMPLDVTGDVKASGVIYAGSGNSNYWSGKQDALVSGSNIKTVNGQSLLGSGGINIDVPIRGAHGLVPVPTSSGMSYFPGINGGGFGVTAGVANRMNLVPFIPSTSFNSVSLSIQVTTGVAGGVIRLLLYSNSNGRPSTKLWESASLDCSTTGVKTAALNTTFVAGTTYWIGIHFSSSTIATYTLQTTQLIPLYNLNGSQTISSYYLTAAIGSAPTTITSGLSGLSSNVPLAIINV